MMNEFKRHNNPYGNASKLMNTPSNMKGSGATVGIKSSGNASLLAASSATVASNAVGVLGPMGISSARPGIGVGIPRQLKPVSTMNSSMSSTSDAGLGAPNFSGKWKLDRDNSDSTNDYLEAMGLPLIARQAADKLDLVVVIQQNNTDFNITRKTRIFQDTKPLKFGEEVVAKNCHIKITAEPDKIRTVSQLPAYNGVLLDTRSMDSERKRMFVKLELQLPDREPVITNRIFVKVSDSTALEFDEDFPLQEKTESKRKR